jgi:hypothetical protein
MQVGYHPRPHLSIVMRTINAHTIHAAFQQLLHEFKVSRSFGGHRNHDVYVSSIRLLAE